MTTHKLTLDHTAGADLYLVAFRSDGKVFDHDTDTWVLLSLPPVTPFVVASEHAGEAGAGDSAFWVDADLSKLNLTATPSDVVLKWYERLGGSPALATDTVLGSTALTIVSGDVAQPMQLDCEFLPNYQLGSDTERFSVQLLSNGQPVTLDGSATCTIAIRQVAPTTGANVFTVGPTTPDGNGLFTLTKQFPTMAAEPVTYRAQITIVNLGVTYTFERLYPSYA